MKENLTKIKWILYCGLFTLYLLFGGAIFVFLEHRHEQVDKEKLTALRVDVIEIFYELDTSYYRNDTSPEVLQLIKTAKDGVFSKLSDYCSGIDFLDPNDAYIYRWNFYNAVFFAFTIVSTIGYGQISPSDDWGRAFVIIFGIIGIPFLGILLNDLGNYFGTKLVNAHKRSKEKKYMSIVSTLIFLIPTLSLFIVLPSVVFTYVENWDIRDSIYYAFVTLSTIGFGDFVAGKGNGDSFLQWTYQIFIIVWIMLGLGYIAMLLGFIAKGMMHKKLRSLIDQQLHSVQFTKDKLSKDVAAMSHLINELYFLRVGQLESHEYSKDSIIDILDGNYERNLVRQPPNTLGVTDPSKKPNDLSQPNGIIHDEFLASVVHVLNSDVMQNVIKAVDSLNEMTEFQQQLSTPEGMRSKLPSVEQLNELKEFTESHQAKNHLNLPGDLMDKVHSVVRKISASTMSSGPSRRVSRNEERRGKTPTLSRKVSPVSSLGHPWESYGSLNPGSSLEDLRLNHPKQPPLVHENRPPSCGPSLKVSRDEWDRRGKIRSRKVSPASSYGHSWQSREGSLNGGSSLEDLGDLGSNFQNSPPSRQWLDDSINLPQVVDANSLASLLHSLDTVYEKLTGDDVKGQVKSKEVAISRGSSNENLHQVLVHTPSTPRMRRRRIGIIHHRPVYVDRHGTLDENNLDEREAQTENDQT